MVLALDQGTTSSRAILFDEGGLPIRVSQREFPQRYPRPGWVEHDPEAIWASVLECAREVLADSAPSAIGITNQRETTVVWDRDTGRPIHPAIVWQDRRTARRCEELAPRSAWIRQRTGLEVDPYFSATKLEWILANVDGSRAKAEGGRLAFGTVDSYLLWRLTDGAVHATDATNASRTMLWNQHTRDWDDELLDLFGVPRAMLPEVRPSASGFGVSSTDVLGQAISICGIAGDQQAATFGQGCLAPGTVKNTYGTGCFLIMVTGEQPPDSRHRLLGTTLCSPDPARPLYGLEGSVFVAGAAIQWLRDGLGIITTADECEALARSVEDSGGVAFVPAFTGLGAPYWEPNARGTITGITRGTNRAHLVRATLESVAHQTQDVLEAASADAKIPIQALRVDGGMVGNAWLMQLQADLSGVPILVPKVAETTARGAAFLAGLSAGMWTAGDLQRMAEAEPAAVYEPKMGADQREALRAAWRAAIVKTQA